MKSFLTFIIFCLSVLGLESYEHTIAISSVFKNEGPWLKEWIEYHKLLGVTHFRLYNNESTDNYLEVLTPYIESGEIELIDWPNKREGDWVNWAKNRQWPAYVDALTKLNGVAKWVAMIDLDEYIHPLEKDNLIDFLDDYEEYCGIAINWQCFGTSNVKSIPENSLMIEMLTKKALEYSHRNAVVKSIVRPEFTIPKETNWPPHTVHYKNHKKAVFPDKTIRKDVLNQKKWEIHPTKAVINHYVHRTEDYLWSKKLAKKAPMQNWSCLKDSKFLHNWYQECNVEEDTRILRFAEDLKKAMNF